MALVFCYLFCWKDQRNAVKHSFSVNGLLLNVGRYKEWHMARLIYQLIRGRMTAGTSCLDTKSEVGEQIERWRQKKLWRERTTEENTKISDTKLSIFKHFGLVQAALNFTVVRFAAQENMECVCSQRIRFVQVAQKQHLERIFTFGLTWFAREKGWAEVENAKHVSKRKSWSDSQTALFSVHWSRTFNE